jgi:hypothetical protein
MPQLRGNEPILGLNNTALGNDEPEEVPGSDAEHALEGVQADVVLMTPLEDDS